MTVLDIYCRELGGALRYAKQFGERRSFFFFFRYCILFSSSSSYVDLSLDTLTYMFSFSLFFLLFSFENVEHRIDFIYSLFLLT